MLQYTAGLYGDFINALYAKSSTLNYSNWLAFYSWAMPNEFKIIARKFGAKIDVFLADIVLTVDIEPSLQILFLA